jgi:hypothetical protein
MRGQTAQSIGRHCGATTAASEISSAAVPSYPRARLAIASPANTAAGSRGSNVSHAAWRWKNGEFRGIMETNCSDP